MSTTPIGTSYAAAETAAVAENPNGLGKQDFLELMIYQLANQNPLNPMESTEFVAQLAQFSSLEQLTLVNDQLELLALGQAGLLTGQSIAMIDKTVVYNDNSIYLGAEQAPGYRIDLADTAKEVTITIKDESGRTVRTMTEGPLGAGTHEWTWDGLNQDGSALPPGTYTVEVSATDGEGQTTTVDVNGIGRVTGVVYDQGYPELMIGETRIDNSTIVEIKS